MITVTQIGDWYGVQKMVNSFNRVAKTTSRIYLNTFADLAAGIAKDHITSQDLNWKALSMAWLDYKQRQGWTEDIYTATGSYYHNIVPIVNMGTLTAFAGVRHGVLSQSSGEPLVAVAEMMEYGFMDYPFVAGGLQARPLWTPTFEEVMIWMQNNMAWDDLFARIMINKASGQYQAKPFGR